MPIFLDASLFCAYANISDVHHKKAKEIMVDIENNKHGKPITTDYIFDESVTVALRKADKNVAVDLGNLILKSEIILAKVDRFVFEQAWSIFMKSDGLSFTDCTNVAFMKIYGIDYIATFDKMFKHIEGIKTVGD